MPGMHAWGSAQVFADALWLAAPCLPGASTSPQAVYLAVYKNFMEGIDAIDNGAVVVVRCWCRVRCAIPTCLKRHCRTPAIPPRPPRLTTTAAPPLPAGVNQWEGDAPPKYMNNTHLSARVGRLNPDWNEDSSGALCCARCAVHAAECSEMLWVPPRSPCCRHRVTAAACLPPTSRRRRCCRCCRH